LAPVSEPHERSPEHYFSAQPHSRSAPGRVELVLPDVRLVLDTDRGVFSPERIDAGTKLLLLEDPFAPGRDRSPSPDAPGASGAVRPALGAAATLVDVGCGYGAVALTLARRHPDATVWAVDVNERALALCRANARALGLANVVVAPPDELPGDLVATAVYSNPPIRVGKAALRALLSDWAARVVAGGSLLLVVARHLGADSLEHWLDTEVGSTRRLAARAGYRVLWTIPRPVRAAVVPVAAPAVAAVAPAAAGAPGRSGVGR
jgi:16S rRNA (guanine1207-N2)-methyltransferase